MKTILQMYTEGKKVVAYHGSPVPIRKFDRNFSAQGVFWFSEDEDKILRGDSGASRVKYMITVELNIKKAAGWKEYEKLGLGQIDQEGYNSIKLDDDWVMFDNKDIKITDVTKVK